MSMIKPLIPFVCRLVVALAPAGASAGDAQPLLAALSQRPVVLLGEVHDNAQQHALRARALRALVEQGSRPALAFEQFDREQQAIIDNARRETPSSEQTLAQHLVERVGAARGWNWAFYLPYLQLALDHDLPIVAANLSRRDAMRVASEGYRAVFDDETIAAFGLNHLPDWLVSAHQQAVHDGHCGLLPAASLPKLARAQIARDAVLAQSLRPYLARGVILFAGNSHLRTDIGVPYFLNPYERAQTVAIALLEEPAPEGAEPFDVVLVTARQPREDPCAALSRSPLRGGTNSSSERQTP